MANITRARKVGNTMHLIADDGKTYIAVPDGHERFLLKPIPVGNVTPPPPPPDGGSGGGGSSGAVGPAPTSLTATTTRGTTVKYGPVQLGHARGILVACAEEPRANNRKVMVIAMITALVESAGLWMYANTSHYPETANYPHDRNGNDSDSVGLFQQRPAAGWGTPKQCMEERYSTRAFLGIAGARPPGLFDKPWESYATPGTAAQRVQVSAFPDRYDVMVPVAEKIIDSMVK